VGKGALLRAVPTRFVTNGGHGARGKACTNYEDRLRVPLPTLRTT
jgi:hypothetical protein